MPRTPIRTSDPPNDAPAPALYRVLSTLERLDGGGFHHTGAILNQADLRPESIAILMERGVIMPHLDPATIASLPELA